MPVSAVDGFLCAVLRGERADWPVDAGFSASLIERADYHGVLALLHDRLQRDPNAGHGWLDEVVQTCRERALAQAMWELRHRALLTEVFTRLASAGIRPVVFKGTALAYTLYSESALRSRGDTDFIIPPDTRTQAAEVLEELGFKRESGMSGERVAYQASFTRTEPAGDAHTLDVHWRINNSELLSRLFSHPELLVTAQSIATLGAEARAASPVHALLIACMHRATHKHNPYYVDGVAHFSGDRLIWLYDIHLLANAFTPGAWEAFLLLASQKGLSSICLEGLQRANQCFHTHTPTAVLAALVQPDSNNKMTQYFAAGATRQQWMDFCAIPGIVGKTEFLVETIFPSAGYMRGKYPQGGWLPWLYFRRAARGVLKKLWGHAGRVP